MSKKRVSEYLQNINPFTGELETPFSEDNNLISDSQNTKKTTSSTSNKFNVTTPLATKSSSFFENISEINKTLTASLTDNAKTKAKSDENTATRNREQCDLIISQDLRFIHRFLSNLLGISIVSAASQPLLTSSAIIEYGKHFGVSYSDSIRNFWNTSHTWKLNRSKGMFQHRLQTSILPASLALSIGEEFEELNSNFLTAIHISLIAGIANLAQRDADVRFNSINGKRFSFVEGINLPSIKNFEDFMSLSSKSDQTSHFNRDDWEVLETRINKMKANMPLYKAALAFRTIIFSAAVFTSKPLAKEISEEFGDEISEKYEVSKDTIESVLENGIFASLAQITTSLNRCLTLLASGKYNSNEVFKKIEQDLLHNPNNLFSGAVARMAFCFTIAYSFREGAQLGSIIRDSINDLFEPEKKQISNRHTESVVSTIKTALDTIITRQEEFSKSSPASSITNPSSEKIAKTNQSTKEK